MGGNDEEISAAVEMPSPAAMLSPLCAEQRFCEDLFHKDCFKVNKVPPCAAKPIFVDQQNVAGKICTPVCTHQVVKICESLSQKTDGQASL